MTSKKVGSSDGQRSSFSVSTQADRNAQAAMSAELKNKTSECFAKLADLQVDATRTILADATIAAKELSTVAAPAQLMLILIAQAHRGVARILNLDEQFAHVAGALQAVYNHTLQSHAADLMHRLLTPLPIPHLIETKIAIKP